MSENPYAGQGPVLLDIGGDIGALVVTMPAQLEGQELEIRPADNHPAPAVPRHVAVLARPDRDRTTYSAVFPDLAAGTYDLNLKPDGPIRLHASITGGEVSYLTWPSTTE